MKKKVLIGFFILFFLAAIGGIFYYCNEKVFISINGKESVIVKFNESYNDSGATAKLCFMSECDDISKKITVVGDVNTDKIGEYYLTYEIEHNEKKYTDKRTIKVVDEVEPVITLKGDINTQMCPKSSFVETGFTATDNYDGDITDKVKVNIKDNEVVYTVEDSSGNTSNAKRTIKRLDNKKPVIKINGNKVEKIKLNSTYTDKGVVVTDDCDIIDKSVVKVSSNVDTSKEGSYTVSYSVTDKAGNVGTANRTVVVQKPVTFDTLDKKEYIANLEKYIKDKNYNVSIGYVNLNTGYTYLYRNNVVYYGASLVKTVDALYIYEKGNFNEDTRKKVEKAISVSDNTAHRQLVNQIGTENLRSYGRDLGASNFLTRSNSDYFGNTTVNDQIAIWKYLYRFINTNSKGSELKKYFINSYCNYLLFDGIPTTMHKYGYYGDYFHDVGIVYADSPYLVVILTKHGNRSFKTVVKDLSEKIYAFNKIDY